jgi:hypothetical protein
MNTKDKQNEWMERLVKNYQLPTETTNEKKEPKRVLKESQLKIIMAKK